MPKPRQTRVLVCGECSDHCIDQCRVQAEQAEAVALKRQKIIRLWRAQYDAYSGVHPAARRGEVALESLLIAGVLTVSDPILAGMA
jgi:hypothetical protein